MEIISQKYLKGSMGIVRSKIILKYKMLNLDDILSNKKKK